jgi:hypothetical protein
MLPYANFNAEDYYPARLVDSMSPMVAGIVEAIMNRRFGMAGDIVKADTPEKKNLGQLMYAVQQFIPPVVGSIPQSMKKQAEREGEKSITAKRVAEKLAGVGIVHPNVKKEEQTFKASYIRQIKDLRGQLFAVRKKNKGVPKDKWESADTEKFERLKGEIKRLSKERSTRWKTYKGEIPYQQSRW